jgi:hypothetical protein
MSHLGAVRRARRTLRPPALDVGLCFGSPIYCLPEQAIFDRHPLAGDSPFTKPVFVMIFKKIAMPLCGSDK